MIEPCRQWLQRNGQTLGAFRRSRKLSTVADRTAEIDSDGILAFSAIRNARVRLPYFLDYYRRQGIDHFLMVDTGSDDGTRDYLSDQPDVSLWTTPHAQGLAQDCLDWLNWLRWRHGHGHWTLAAGPDEFFVYPFCDTRPIRALTDWLDTCGIRSVSAMQIDMYPKGRVDAEPYVEGQDPFEIATWFDACNYLISRDPAYLHLRIQGGPRSRAFFADAPETAPALNRIPLVKWRRGDVYLQHGQVLLPRALNRVYETRGGEMISGAVLHAGFLHTRGQGSDDNRANDADQGQDTLLWNKWSEKYINWRQLEILGLISKGNWA